MKQSLCALFKVMLFFNLLLLVQQPLYAKNKGDNNLDTQDLIIEGTVVASDNGLPLAGVNIMVKGVKNGTSTDNVEQVIQLSLDNLQTLLIPLDEIDISKNIQYRSVYQAFDNSIDLFYTDYAEFVIE
ncbi:MAG: hypothetical protein ABJM36_02165 [Algibacter sp.]|uniref:hypothetical protein n=1 Tax=Algibacter sp. TaxID=1872428 RepID=UPI003299961B